MSVLDSLIEHILIHYRWVFVIAFLLPASFFFDIYHYLRAWLIFQLNTAPRAHDKKVRRVQEQVKEWAKHGRKGFICTARPGWQTISFRKPKYKETFTKINVNLVDIVDVDVERMIVKVEPMVSMGQLTALLEPLGWTIPVVPELDELTVGGLINGTGIETSSHKHGLFVDTCESFELVLSTGEIVKCSRDENSDLFHSVAWSYGTIGFLTAAEIKIIPAKRFVKLEYIPCHSLEHSVHVFEEQTSRIEGNQFVEGIMFNRDQGVIMVGNMTTSADPKKLNRIGTWHKPWFFKHVESYLSTGPGHEYIPIRDYYHRHSRSIFWEIQEIIPFGNNILFRYLFGWLVPPKVSLLKLTQPPAVKRLYEANHLIQDMLVPLSKLMDSIICFDKETKIYPVWLCPFKLSKSPGMLRRKGAQEEEMFVDLGLYGVPKVKNFRARETTRSLEAFVRKVQGFQMLYADTYMTKEEFRQMFNHELYDKTRKKYHAELAFPEVYDKVSLKARE